jgi:hypothetical protein
MPGWKSVLQKRAQNCDMGMPLALEKTGLWRFSRNTRGSMLQKWGRKCSVLGEAGEIPSSKSQIPNKIEGQNPKWERALRQVENASAASAFEAFSRAFGVAA